MRTENLKYPKYGNENIKTKYLNNTGIKRFLKQKNSLLELENDFIELKDRELKDRELKIKSETEELFFEPIFLSIDDRNKFEPKEMKKKRPIKNTLPQRKNVNGFKNKFVSFLSQTYLRIMTKKLCMGAERN